MVSIGALGLDALRPDLVRLLNVDEQTAVERRFLRLLGGVAPLVSNHVVLETLVAVEVTVRLPGAMNDAFLDCPRGRRVGVLAGEERLPAGQVLAVEQRREAVFGLLFFGGGTGQLQGGEHGSAGGEAAEGAPARVGIRPARCRPADGSAGQRDCTTRGR